MTDAQTKHAQGDGGRSSPSNPISSRGSRPTRRPHPGSAACGLATPHGRTPKAGPSSTRRSGGNLIAVDAPFAACATDPKSAPCVDALANIRNPFYIGDQPGGTQVSGWLDAWTPAPSAYAVKARSSSDVAAAVNFARDNRLRLVVKGAGHSYQGTSNAPDSLLDLDPRDERGDVA